MVIKTNHNHLYIAVKFNKYTYEIRFPTTLFAVESRRYNNPGCLRYNKPGCLLTFALWCHHDWLMGTVMSQWCCPITSFDEKQLNCDKIFNTSGLSLWSKWLLNLVDLSTWTSIYDVLFNCRFSVAVYQWVQHTEPVFTTIHFTSRVKLKRLLLFSYSAIKLFHAIVHHKHQIILILIGI